MSLPLDMTVASSLSLNVNVLVSVCLFVFALVNVCVYVCVHQCALKLINVYVIPFLN